MRSRSSSLFFRAVTTLGTCAALSLSLVACGGGGGTSGGADQPSGGGESGGLVGSPAPAFAAEAVTGEGPTSVADAKGRVVILDFWATYCGPCKKSFPKYQSMMDEFAGEVAVIAVSVDDADDADKAKIEDFVKETGVKFAVVWDKDKSAVKMYNPPKMPTSFIIDKEGVIKHMHAGYGEGEEEEISKEIHALLGK